jgi:uncharacterized protein (DUF433 family)
MTDMKRMDVVYNVITMAMLETTINAPLTQWEDGSIRITGSRVPIDTVIYHFKLGATAEEIGYKFTSLRLADIYGVIYYYQKLTPFSSASNPTPSISNRKPRCVSGC